MPWLLSVEARAVAHGNWEGAWTFADWRAVVAALCPGSGTLSLKWNQRLELARLGRCQLRSGNSARAGLRAGTVLIVIIFSPVPVETETGSNPFSFQQLGCLFWMRHLGFSVISPSHLRLIWAHHAAQAVSWKLHACCLNWPNNWLALLAHSKVLLVIHRYLPYFAFLHSLLPFCSSFQTCSGTLFRRSCLPGALCIVGASYLWFVIQEFTSGFVGCFAFRRANLSRWWSGCWIGSLEALLAWHIAMSLDLCSDSPTWATLSCWLGSRYLNSCGSTGLPPLGSFSAHSSLVRRTGIYSDPVASSWTSW